VPMILERKLLLNLAAMS